MLLHLRATDLLSTGRDAACCQPAGSEMKPAEAAPKAAIPSANIPPVQPAPEVSTPKKPETPAEPKPDIKPDIKVEPKPELPVKKWRRSKFPPSGDCH